MDTSKVDRARAESPFGASTAAIVACLRAHGVVHAAVFGSVARGASNHASDVDMLVEFSTGRSLIDQAALELDLTEMVGRPVEVVTYGALDPRIRENALREQRVLL
ncbi:MAG TPA: nucleotidyltransferase family protein [Ktedonobacterales bacterium]|nr:nucleotidyltransferase family protein [Ktedonobacterales bacterium]